MTELNNGIAERDIHWQGVMGNIELTISVKDREDGENKIKQILNNHAIVKALEKDLKETEEYFRESNDDVQRRILDYHAVMVRAVLRETLHSNGSGGTK